MQTIWHILKYLYIYIDSGLVSSLNFPPLHIKTPPGHHKPNSLTILQQPIMQQWFLHNKNMPLIRIGRKQLSIKFHRY